MAQTIQSPKPNLAQSYRAMADRIKESHRGYWTPAPGGGWMLVTDPVKCMIKIQELRAIANELDSDERYDAMVQS